MLPQHLAELQVLPKTRLRVWLVLRGFLGLPPGDSTWQPKPSPCYDKIRHLSPLAPWDGLVLQISAIIRALRYGSPSNIGYQARTAPEDHHFTPQPCEPRPRAPA